MDLAVAPGRARLDNLTGLRAFAAAWVMLMHYSLNTGFGEYLQFPRVILHGGYGVDLFFVLSGVVITFNYLGALKAEHPFGPAYRDYLAKRFARIYPLHLATFLAVVWLLWEGTSQGYRLFAGTLYTPFSALLNLTLMQAWGILDRFSWNFVAWSLSAEWFAYLLVFPACVHLLERCNWKQVLLIVAVPWIGLNGILQFVTHHSITSITHDGFLRILPEFMAGYVLCRMCLLPGIPRNAAQENENAPRSASAALLAVTAGSLVFVAMSWHGRLELLVLPAALAILWGLMHGHPILDAIFGNRLTVFLGETSFALYMLHPFVRIVGNHVMELHPAWNTRAHALSVLFIEVAACYVISSAVYFAFERPARLYTLGLLRRVLSGPVGAPTGQPRRTREMIRPPLS